MSKKLPRTVKTIALDMDGVLADMLPRLLYLLNRYHGEKLTPADITTWDIAPHCTNATSEHIIDYFKEPGFFRHLYPMPGALDAVNHLLEIGYKIIIITASHKTTKADKLVWLKNHLPGISPEDVHFEYRKHKIKADMLVDDNVDNCEAYKKAHPSALVVCFDAPYNQDFTGLRAKNWQEVLNWIKTAESIRPDTWKPRP